MLYLIALINEGPWDESYFSSLGFDVAWNQCRVFAKNMDYGGKRNFAQYEKFDESIKRLEEDILLQILAALQYQS